MTGLKLRIQRHYDVATPLYRQLWGEHIHHGFWKDGNETKEIAQEQLIELLAREAELRQDARVLDIGCGFGGSAKYLAQRFQSRVVGVTISFTQASAAISLNQNIEPQPLFVQMDAEQLGVSGTFDVVWCVESISHLCEKMLFFRKVCDLLSPRGRVAIIDWFKADDVSPANEARYIRPIADYMLAPDLRTVRDYVAMLSTTGFRVIKSQDISASVSRTWEVCLKFADLPEVVSFAAGNGADFVSFLKGFSAMREGFRSRTFHCELLVAEKLDV